MICDDVNCYHPIDDHPTHGNTESNTCVGIAERGGEKVSCLCRKLVSSATQMAPTPEDNIPVMSTYTTLDGTLIDKETWHSRRMEFIAACWERGLFQNYKNSEGEKE